MLYEIKAKATKTDRTFADDDNEPLWLYVKMNDHGFTGFLLAYTPGGKKGESHFSYEHYNQFGGGPRYAGGYSPFVGDDTIFEASDLLKFFQERAKNVPKCIMDYVVPILKTYIAKNESRFIDRMNKELNESEDQ